MAKYRQRDYMIEAEDALRIKGSRELQAIVDALPAKPLLRVFEIIEPEGPLAVSSETVYRWIESGRFSVLNAGSSDKSRYQIFRYSLIEFLGRRVVKGGA